MTREDIVGYCRAYPAAQLQDVFKFLFHSTKGCEHAVCAAETALTAVTAELPDAANDVCPAVEDLPGDFCRVHLSAVGALCSAEELARLFATSATPVAHGDARLQTALDELQALCDAHALPFDAEEARQAIAAWRAAGSPPVRHSDVFRAAYHPHYRVIRKSLLP